MAWLFLFVAGLMEVCFTTALRYVEGFTRFGPTLLFVLFMVASLYCLERAARDIPLGTAYAVWTGIGAAGTVLVGALFFHEPISALRLAFLAMLIASIVGLRLAVP
jgi:quaternary ammonium compound-resistance protein SugE